MLSAKLVATLEEVPERIIIQAADDLEGEENNFKKLLESAEEFRHQGCTPIYLGKKDYSAFCVTSKETIDPKKLH
jgi:hypothetical protein